jgi:hypothetical protein
MISRSRVLIVAGLGTLVVLCPSFTLADSSTCTPALFERTSETIRMPNGAFEKEFHELQRAVADHPELTDGASVTWTRTMMSGAVEQTTLTRISTGNYSFEEDEASEDSPTIFVKVVSATLAFTPGSVSTPSEIKVCRAAATSDNLQAKSCITSRLL